MKSRVSISSIFFYVLGLIIVGVAISSVSVYILEFIPYWIAGFISIMPLYGKVKESVQNVRIGYSKIVKTIFRKISSSSSTMIVALTVIVSLRSSLLQILVRSVLMSVVGLSLVFIAWETTRLLLKVFKKVEIMSFKKAFISAL